MTLDDKDLEIARLRGKVEALEEQLAATLAKRLGPIAPMECAHIERDLQGRCARCTIQIVPTIEWAAKADPTCKNVTYLEGVVWTGMTRPDLSDLAAWRVGQLTPGKASS